MTALTEIVRKLNHVAMEIDNEARNNHVDPSPFHVMIQSVDAYLRVLFNDLLAIIPMWKDLNEICGVCRTASHLSSHEIDTWSSQCSEKFIEILNAGVFHSIIYLCTSFVDSRYINDANYHIDCCEKMSHLLMFLNNMYSSINMFSMCSAKYVKELYHLFSYAVTCLTKVLDVHWSILSKILSYIDSGLIDKNTMPELSGFISVGMSNFKSHDAIDSRLLTIVAINDALLGKYMPLYSDTRMITAQLPFLIQSAHQIGSESLLDIIEEI